VGSRHHAAHRVPDPAREEERHQRRKRRADHAGLDLEATYADLCRLTRRLVTTADAAQSLCDKLVAAEAAAAADKTNARDGALSAFRDQVAAQTGKSISAADAATLRSLSEPLQ